MFWILIFVCSIFWVSSIPNPSQVHRDAEEKAARRYVAVTDAAMEAYERMK